jgi:hypothetical protein
MRTSTVVGAAVAVLALGGSAHAQGFGFYVGPGPGAYLYDDDYGPAYEYVAPRAYTERRIVRPARRCGTYRYWNGAYCVDARDR